MDEAARRALDILEKSAPALLKQAHAAYMADYASGLFFGMVVLASGVYFYFQSASSKDETTRAFGAAGAVMVFFIGLLFCAVAASGLVQGIVAPDVVALKSLLGSVR